MKTTLIDIIDQYNLLPNNEFRVWFLNNMENLLDKEREQILDSHIRGYIIGGGDGLLYDPVCYYDETYNIDDSIINMMKDRIVENDK